ncbi:MAG: hypothetical protein JWQ93_1621 [Marmoricola sp.]|nr:hypothetical protein [Marmoricola sp.]
MSMALSPDIKQVVQDSIGQDPVILLDVVVDELEHRKRMDGATSLAAVALRDLAWLGTPANTDRATNVDDVLEIQAQIADVRVLRDEFEHWAESVTIAMIRAAANRGSTREMRFLTEDHDARVQANKEPICAPLSIDRLMWERVQAGKLAANEAARLAGLIYSANRGPDCTAQEFSARHRRGLGRAGQP